MKRGTRFSCHSVFFVKGFFYKENSGKGTNELLSIKRMQYSEQVMLHPNEFPLMLKKN